MNKKLGIPFFVNNVNGWVWQNSLDIEMDFISPFEICKTNYEGKSWEIQYVNDSIAIDAGLCFIDKNIDWIGGKMEVGQKPIFIHTSNGGEDWIELKINNDLLLKNIVINNIFFLTYEIGWLSISVLGNHEENDFFEVASGIIILDLAYLMGVS